MTPQGDAERGYAFLAALWFVVALSAVTLDWGLRTHDQFRVAVNRLAEARARAAAEAGIEHARSLLERLLHEAAPLQVHPQDTERQLDPWAVAAAHTLGPVPLGDAAYRVEIGDAGARLNLNRATEDELRRLFAALGVESGLADQLAQALMDWMDEDDLHRPRGAERDDYLRAGRREMPRNGPLQRIEELLHVWGMTPEILARARPYVTLLGVGKINLNAAPRPVLETLPGLGEEAIRWAMQLRGRDGRLASLAELEQHLSVNARDRLSSAYPELLQRVVLETLYLELHSEGWVEGNPIRVRSEALLVRGPGTTFLTGQRTGGDGQE